MGKLLQFTITSNYAINIAAPSFVTRQFVDVIVALRIHVWNIYLHWDYLENYFRGQLVGKYSSTMDPLGNCSQINCIRVLNKSGQSKIVGKPVRVRSHQCSVSYWHFCLGSAALRKLNAYTFFSVRNKQLQLVSQVCDPLDVIFWHHDTMTFFWWPAVWPIQIGSNQVVEAKSQMMGQCNPASLYFTTN